MLVTPWQALIAEMEAEDGCDVEDFDPLTDEKIRADDGLASNNNKPLVLEDVGTDGELLSARSNQSAAPANGNGTHEAGSAKVPQRLDAVKSKSPLPPPIAAGDLQASGALLMTGQLASSPAAALKTLIPDAVTPLPPPQPAED